MTKVQTEKVKAEDNDIRIDRWFKRNFPAFSHTSIEKALRKGQIRIDGKKVKSSTHVLEGQEIRVPPMKEYIREDKPKPKIDEKYITEIQKSVIYKDKDIIVINKPAGLPTQGGVGINVSVDSLLEFLKFDYDKRPKLVHRLDKDTSGALVLARSTTTASELTSAFKSKNIEKTYLALVVGNPELDEGKIDLSISKQDSGAGKEKMIADKKGQKAVTYYKVIEKMGKKLSLVELYPHTGRTHQLRIHMSHLGNPILGDGKYGGKLAFIEGLSKKMHLHSYSIQLPGYQKPFFAEVTGKMAETFNKLGISHK
ncbi:MAG: RluA family pseudouridine synthase [Rickettsiales bacterium]|nr:RluA family pseudouridine synthase [Pseudomonadota bacterium]MDA0966226.1 RluA family pseudouridine synthase [Pseudomonadota bacterium]MDG4543109.1 RluA family pseudouridine synthase [Rickettsiales bacterium]MDG4545307.1 RluA family pseudouridine synthase [Rickettsiales bacterium]MDG4547756.1 RluA family pseudouridine synthase [Rickettsiales bacterium]